MKSRWIIGDVGRARNSTQDIFVNFVTFVSAHQEGIQSPAMLTIYRRHLKDCTHRPEGRSYRRCKCPIWVDGTLNGAELRKSLKSRNWEHCQEIVREWESNATTPRKPEPISVQQACSRFETDVVARGLSEATVYKYRQLFQQLRAFAEHKGLRYLQEFDVDLLRDFRASWKDGSISALKKLERLSCFLRFALDTGWIHTNPTKGIKKPKVTDPPTMPFTQEQMVTILDACGRYPDNYGRFGQVNARRLRAFVLTLRYSGMRIGDVVGLSGPAEWDKVVPLHAENASARILSFTAVCGGGARQHRSLVCGEFLLDG